MRYTTTTPRHSRKWLDFALERLAESSRHPLCGSTITGVEEWEPRYWARVSKTEGCWLWTGARTSRGYGVITIRYKSLYVHRLALQLAGRPLGPGELACHHCDTPLCVRPDHLFAGTVADNAADMVAKGRSYRLPKSAAHRLHLSIAGKRRFAERPETHHERMKTHCPQGHPYSVENTFREANGSRKCRECGRARARRDYWRRKQAA